MSAQQGIDPAALQLTTQWLQKRFQSLLGFDKPEDAAELVKYTLSLQPQEMEDHIIVQLYYYEG